MLSIVVTLLLLVIALLIVGSLLFGAKWERQCLARSLGDSISRTQHTFSSTWYTQRMSYRMFFGMWLGFSAVLTPD